MWQDGKKYIYKNFRKLYERQNNLAELVSEKKIRKNGERYIVIQGRVE